MIKVFGIITKPVKTITNYKKSNISNVMAYLLLIVVINVIALGIFTWNTLGLDKVTVILGLIGYLVIAYLAILFMAYLLKIAISTLHNNVSYYNSLTPLTLGAVAPALGFLLFSLLGLIPKEITILGFLGSLLGFLVMAISIVLGLAITIKAIKEFSKVDTLTAIVALSLVYIGVIIASYLLASQVLLGNVNLFAGNFGPTNGLY